MANPFATDRSGIGDLPLALASITLSRDEDPIFPPEIVVNIIRQVVGNGLQISNDPGQCIYRLQIRSLLRTNHTVSSELLKQIYRRPLHLRMAVVGFGSTRDVPSLPVHIVPISTAVKIAGVNRYVFLASAVRRRVEEDE